jgi:hypothetical protein
VRDSTLFMDSSQQLEYFKCPFCLNHSVEAKPGKTTCPGCSAEFEVDDRVECIFAHTREIRLPVNGFVCGVCGLVQGDENRNKMFENKDDVKNEIYLFCPRKGTPKKHIRVCRRCRWLKSCKEYQGYIQPELPFVFEKKSISVRKSFYNAKSRSVQG